MLSKQWGQRTATSLLSGKMTVCHTWRMACLYGTTCSVLKWTAGVSPIAFTSCLCKHITSIRGIFSSGGASHAPIPITNTCCIIALVYHEALSCLGSP